MPSFLLLNKFRFTLAGALVASAFCALPLAYADAIPGQAAPAFSLTDTAGKKVSLADYKGKHVVLEWVNPGCPYVRKHYDSKNMQSLQDGALKKNVVWLAINSTNPSHQDYLAPTAMADYMKKQNAAASATLMDSDGKVGLSYGAKTTPHMYVIDPQGKVVFAGGIDDKRSSRVEDVKTAKNFVAAALDDSLSGKPVQVASAIPYGCSVKY